MLTFGNCGTIIRFFRGWGTTIKELVKQAPTRGGSNMIASLKTDADLIRRLQESASKPVSKEELARQRVSFVYGNLPSNSTITRDRVAERIKENEGA